MNSQDQMGIYQELQEKGWLNFASIYRASSSGVYGKMYQLTHSYNSVTGQFGLPNTPEARAAYLRQAEFRNTDWFDLLFSNSLMMNHSVSMATGSEKSSSYISLSLMNDPGWMKQSKVSRYTANLNNTYNITKQFSFTESPMPLTVSSRPRGHWGKAVMPFLVRYPVLLTSTLIHMP